MRIRPLALALCVALPFASASAQVRKDAGVVMNGKVVVKAYVTLANDVIRYFPVAGQRFVFYRGSADSTVVSTDAVGGITVLLPAGDYRLVSASDVLWQGRSYRWSLPVQVRPDMGIVDLTAENAVVRDRAVAAAVSATPSGATAAAAAPVSTPAVSPATVTVMPPGAYKDPTTATLFSLLIAGGGQLYSGETGSGLFLLAADITGAALFVTGASHVATCDPYVGESCSGADSQASIGLGVSLGASLISIIDAHSAAHRHNRKTGAEPAAARGVGALIGPGARGTTRAGVSIAFGR